VSKLLIKKREQRLNIRDTLDHPWFDSLGEISQMRREAKKEGDEMKTFITYANSDADMAREASKKS
jgi:hypothetical protein